VNQHLPCTTPSQTYLAYSHPDHYRRHMDPPYVSNPMRSLTLHLPNVLQVGQCIGRRNYRFFLGFVISVCLLSVFVAAFSALMALRVARQAYAGKKPPFVDILSKAISLQPGAVVMVVFPLLILLCVGPLSCYHCTLVCQNKTTSEEIKLPYGNANPFSKGCARNCQEACCSRSSRVIQPRSLASEDMGTAAMLSDEGEPNDHSAVASLRSSTFETGTCSSSPPVSGGSHMAAAVIPVDDTDALGSRRHEAPNVALCGQCKNDDDLPV